MSPQAGLLKRPPTAAQIRRAAQLGYEDAETDEQIARRLGITRRTLARWKKRPEYQAARQRCVEQGRLSLDGSL